MQHMTSQLHTFLEEVAAERLAALMGLAVALLLGLRVTDTSLTSLALLLRVVRVVPSAPLSDTDRLLLLLFTVAGASWEVLATLVEELPFLSCLNASS